MMLFSNFQKPIFKMPLADKSLLLPLWSLGALLASLTPLTAQAQIYICKDAAGRTLTADRPLPECANRSTRELDRSGITRRETAAPLSPEQRRERQAQEEKQRIIAAGIEERRLYDRALMTRYRSYSDIAIARQRAISLLEDQRRIDTSALTGEMKEMKSAQAAVAAGSRNKLAAASAPVSARPPVAEPTDPTGLTAPTPPSASNAVSPAKSPAAPRPISPAVKKRLEEAARAVDLRLSSIESRNAEIERTNQRFDQAVKRFNEIRSAQDARRTSDSPP